MPATRPRASLIYNPNAGRRGHASTIDAIQGELAVGYELVTTPTSGAGDAIRLAKEAAARGEGAVFAWGGDGTIREVVEGILGSEVMLGVLPGGTFNVVALAIGLSRNPVEAARSLATARPSARDVGLIGATPFLMQATAGLDGFIMHRLRADMKARFGFAGVAFDGLRAFARYRFRPFNVDVDGAVHRVTGAAFVNLPEYAGRYQFVPGGRWDDRKAHALLYTGRTHLQALMFALGLGLGTHHRRADVKIVEARRMTILNDSPIYIQTDGDPWHGELPVTCRLATETLQVLIPETPRRR
jgi:diacylglycerol kinase family enzyme